MSKNISVIYCFPRSGGTLLNQCLLCEPANVVLSEINPAGCVLAVERQAAEWFGLINAAETAGHDDRPYLDKISLVHQRAQEAGKQVCLRDWTGINFFAGISPWHGTPSLQLEQRTYLSHAGFTLKEIALLRRSKAVYQSILENIPELKDLTPEAFCSVYRSYLAQIPSVKKHRLEDLVGDKQNVVRSICIDLDLRYPADFETRFHTLKTVTGNNTLSKLPASAQWTSIRKSEANPMAAQKLFSAQEDLFEELDGLAGYELSTR